MVERGQHSLSRAHLCAHRSHLLYNKRAPLDCGRSLFSRRDHVERTPRGETDAVSGEPTSRSAGRRRRGRVPPHDGTRQSDRDAPLSAPASPAGRSPAHTGSAGGSSSRWAGSPGRPPRPPARCASTAIADPAWAPPRAAPRCTDAAGCRNSSSVSAISTSLPTYITATRSLMCSTTLRSCATNR